MADLFQITAPLVVRRSGVQSVIALLFPHPRGVLYFDLFWHVGVPDQTIHLILGPISGDGPWKVGQAVIDILGCHGTDPSLALEYETWQEYLGNATDYPSPKQIATIARRFGARVD